MKSRSVAGAVLGALFVGVLVMPSSFGAIKAGTTCKKAGLQTTDGGRKYTCIKQGKKFVWNKGVVVKAVPVANPSPSATPSPSPSASASPTPIIEIDPQKTSDVPDHILVMGLCGARWGELVALKVSDIDFKTGKLSITKTMEEIDGHLYEKDSTKTNESREVEIIDFLMRRAPKWVAGKLPTDPLFTTQEGTILRRSNFGRRVFHPALAKAKVPQMRVHDLRWTFVTLCSSLGIKQNVIRKMTGHTTDYMTAAYTKVFKEDMSKEMEKLNASAYEVHAMCTDEAKPEIVALTKSENYAQNEESLVVKALQEWLGQQDYESGALTN